MTTANIRLPISSVDTESDAIFLLSKLAERTLTREDYVKTVGAAIETLEAIGLSEGLYYMDEDMVNDCWEEYQDGI